MLTELNIMLKNRIKEAELMLNKAFIEYRKFNTKYHYYDVYWAKEEIAAAKGDYVQAREIAKDIHQKLLWRNMMNRL